jgi:hypothetical protein
MVGRTLVGTGKNEFQACKNTRARHAARAADSLVDPEWQDNSQFVGFAYKLILPKRVVPDMPCFYRRGRL